jgi:hypothetical protein
LAQEPFYIASESDLAGAPGTIIRQEPATRAPDGATAFRILYRSTGLKGEPIAASALVVIPRGASPKVAGLSSPGRIRPAVSCRNVRRRWRGTSSTVSRVSRG